MNENQKKELGDFLEKMDVESIANFYKDFKITTVMTLFNKGVSRKKIKWLLGGNSYRVIWNIVKANRLKLSSTEEVEQDDG